jgi:hypothetical protein
MNEKFKSAMDAVEKINGEIFDKYKKLDQNDHFKYWLDLRPIISITISDNYFFIDISIPDIQTFNVYSSYDDKRIYYEKSDKYETFYKFIKRRFREIKEYLNTIKI